MSATPELHFPAPTDAIGLPDADLVRGIDPRVGDMLHELCAGLRIGHESGIRISHSLPAPGRGPLETDLAAVQCLAVVLRPSTALRRRLRHRYERAEASVQAFGGPKDRERLDHAGALLEELERFAVSPEFLRLDEHRPAGDVLWGVESRLDGAPGIARRRGLTFERCSWDWAAALHWGDEGEDPFALFPRILGFVELTDPNRTLSAFLAWHTEDVAGPGADVRMVTAEGIAGNYLLACCTADESDGFSGRLIAGLGTGVLEALAEDYPSFSAPEFRRDALRLVQPVPEALEIFGLPRGPGRLRKLAAAEMRAARARRHCWRLDREAERALERRRLDAAEPRPPDRFPARTTVRSMTALDRARLLAWVRTLPGVIDAGVHWADGEAPHLRIEWRTNAGSQHVDLAVNDHRPVRDVLGRQRDRFPHEGGC